MSRVVFISHRHADEKIATVLNEQLQSWQFPKDKIFQSSDAQGGGAGIGGKLNQELLRALSETRLVLLVYTVADADWSYCMWECGVAMRNDTPTRIVVFRVTEDMPQVLRDLVSVRTVESDIKRFVYQFFKEKDWVREGEAFNSELADRVLDDYSKKLFTALHEVTPKLKAHSKPRWDLFTLRFEALSVQKILVESQKDHGNALNLIQREGKVVDDFGQALVHFGYDAKVRDLTLSHLTERWCGQVGADSPRDWIAELGAELLRAFKNMPAKPSWALMLSQLYPDWWFYPVVNTERMGADGSIEIDIHMYRLPGMLPPSLK